MKKVIIIIISSFLFQLIFGNEIKNNADLKEATYNANMSLGLINGVSVGYGKIKYDKKSATEYTFNIHYHTCHFFYATGIYSQINIFKNKQRKGIFYLVSGGVDYTKGESLFYYNINGPNNDNKNKYEELFPYVALGLGYSFPIKKQNNWRIYWDIGLKKSISNLNVSINF